MNVAVVATPLFPSTRSRTIAMLVRAIRIAAEHQPAPDLIVLPDCRHCASQEANQPRWSSAMCTGLIETIAWQAREWGVWIAAGHAVANGGQLIGGATLFDPDGDRYLHLPVGAADHAAPAASDHWSVRATPLGVCALATGRNLPASPAIVTTAGPPDLVLIPAARHGTTCTLEWLSALARSSRAYVCLALAVPTGEALDANLPMSAVVVDPNGDVLASTPLTTGIIHCTLDITPALAPSITEESGYLE